MTSSESLHSQLERLRRQRAWLSNQTPEHIAKSITKALALLTDPNWPKHTQALADIQRCSSLSQGMLRWAFTTIAECYQPGDLKTGIEIPRPRTSSFARSQLAFCATLLAGNHPAASIEGLCLPLLQGKPVLAKLPSRDPATALWFSVALKEVDAQLADCIALQRFDHNDTQTLTRFLNSSAELIAYGRDETMQALRQQLSPAQQLTTHGTRVGYAFVAAKVFNNTAQVSDTAEQLALDIAAYDQRGCFSPAAVFAQTDDKQIAQAFAQQLAEALERIHQTLPLGELPDSVAFAQHSWRAVAAVTGQLWQGESASVSCETLQSLRSTPGWRCIAVHPCADVGHFLDILQSQTNAISTIGIAGGNESLNAMGQACAERNIQARLCKAGEMQRPTLKELTIQFISSDS